MNSTKLIKLSKSCIGDAEKIAVIGVLDREYLGMGAEVHQFEQVLTEFFGRPVACVSNGTAALQLALQACGIGKGDEVLVQSLTYVASFQAISATGAIPVACDIDSSTMTLDWRDAEKRLTPNTRAIMPVHYSGGVGALEEIYGFAHKYGLRVVEDAAHAFGTVYNNKKVGGFGDIACFSFDGIKNITSGEGGCIVTEDPLVLARIRDARLLGVEKDTELRYAGERSWEFGVSEQGWRYHMSNIMAAIGIEQLKRFDEFANIRQTLAKHYQDHLRPYGALRLFQNDYNEVVPHIFSILLPSGTERESLRQRLLELRIQTGVHYQPNHCLTLFKNSDAAPLQVTDAISERLLSLPLHPDVSTADVDYVCSSLLALL
jgi:dTDP-4-amino-4,6-dideoxygalactose transaminase